MHARNINRAFMTAGSKSVHNMCEILKKPVLGYISDLHLERNTRIHPYDIVPNSDYLALCGDNGDPFKNHYRELLIYASMNFEHTVFIAGNHEYDGISNPAIVVDRLNEISHDLPNVEFLNRTATNIAGYTIIGATLWTNRDKSLISPYDNRYIKKLWTANVINSMHRQDMDWLTHMIGNTPNKKIVLTHHVPTFQLRSSFYKEFPNQFMFYNNLDHLLNSDDVYAWICGHSHCKNTKVINGTYCGINAYGVNRKVMPKLAHIDI